jgi:hypothetical protein
VHEIGLFAAKDARKEELHPYSFFLTPMPIDPPDPCRRVAVKERRAVGEEKDLLQLARRGEPAEEMFDVVSDPALSSAERCCVHAQLYAHRRPSSEMRAVQTSAIGENRLR